MASLFPGEQALYASVHDHREVHDRLTSLLFLRVLTDPTMPEVGGHDSRAVLEDGFAWEELVAVREPGLWLDVICARLNEVMGEDLLCGKWSEIPDSTLANTLEKLGRWRPGEHQGDVLGVASQEMTHGSAKAAKGAFYTPYPICLMMAMMTDPKPGQSVCDPAAGSGSMLLAALEHCRTKYGRDKWLEVYGVDIDPGAVRLCKLNMVLAGIGSTSKRAAPEDTPLGQAIKKAAIGDQYELFAA